MLNNTEVKEMLESIVSLVATISKEDNQEHREALIVGAKEGLREGNELLIQELRKIYPFTTRLHLDAESTAEINFREFLNSSDIEEDFLEISDFYKLEEVCKIADKEISAEVFLESSLITSLNIFKFQSGILEHFKSKKLTDIAPVLEQYKHLIMIDK